MAKYYFAISLAIIPFLFSYFLFREMPKSFWDSALLRPAEKEARYWTPLLSSYLGQDLLSCQLGFVAQTLRLRA